MTAFSPLSGAPAIDAATLAQTSVRKIDPSAGPDALRETAKAFETVFLAEMLTHAGLARTRESFGGGVGEDAFGSFLAREWAEKIVDAGGIGIADRIAESLAPKRSDDA